LKDAVTVPPEIHSKYVGTYERQIPKGPREIKVTLEDGRLTLSFEGDSPWRATAHSETTFTAFGTRYEFFKGDRGEVTHFMMTDDSGEWRADRKK
jgi:hypothetical protein